MERILIINARCALATGIVFALSSGAHSQSIFTADFDDFTSGNFNGGQFETDWDLGVGGNLPGWNKSGGGTVHIIDHANQTGDLVNPRNFAVMIWENNVITQDVATAVSNEIGTEYVVEFLASPAVYQAGNQQTSAADGLLIELLNSSDEVVAAYIHLPGAWAGNTILLPDSFTYTGDGTGDVRFRVGPSNFNSGRFGGAIDNLVLAPATFALPPDIISITPPDFQTGAVVITFSSEAGAKYLVRATDTLLPNDWTTLDPDVDGTGDTTLFTDSTFAPTHPDLGIYQIERLSP